MKIKTADLIGPALNWAVAKCEGFSIELEPENGGRFWLTRTNHTQQYLPPFGYLDETFFPSSDWSQGGPIIERESITLRVNACLPGYWAAFIDFGGSNCNIKARQSGPTPLVTAMRCYCCAKLGEFVNIPEGLM